MKKKKQIFAAVLFGFLSVGMCVGETNRIDPSRIIVTATRNANDFCTIPYNPLIISSKDIARGHASSVPEILKKTAGVFFHNYTGNPSQAAIDMRGFGENSQGRVLVLVDGRRLNEADMAIINWSTIPIDQIERIEVLNGPATVLYGDNAIGGVINMITAKGSEKQQTSLTGSVGSDEALEKNASISGDLDGLGYTMTAGHQSSDGYRDHSRYDNTSFCVGFDFMPNDFFSGKAGFSIINRHDQLPGALSVEQTDSNRKQSDERSNVSDTQHSTYLGGVFTPNDENTFAIDFAYRHLDQHANLNRELGAWGTYFDANKETWTIEPRTIFTWSLGDAMNETTIGLDWRNEIILVDRFASEAHTAQSADVKVEQKTLDIYLNNQFFLLDEKLIFNIGERIGQSRINVKDIDRTKAKLLYDETKNRHENAFIFSITTLPTDHIKLYAKYDEFYRFPFTDEQALYFGFDGIDAFTDLQPERGKNFEIGGSLSPTKKCEISMTLYRMEMENEIRYNPSTYANENLPGTLRQGIELTANYAPNDRLHFGFIYNYTNAKFDKGTNKENRIPWVARHRIRAAIDGTPLNDLTLTAGVTYTSKMYAINDNGNNGIVQGGYTLIDLMLTYTKIGRKITWDLFAGIDNLFEKEYDLWQISDANGSEINHYPAPKRTWKAGFDVKF